LVEECLPDVREVGPLLREISPGGHRTKL
jgi:hypothetical protein